MTQVLKKTVDKFLIGALLLFCSLSFCQEDIQASLRLDNFLNRSCTTHFKEITSESVKNILKHNVYYITQETMNIYGEKEKQVIEFIVIDDGQKVNRFEHIKTDTELPALASYIREDFRLNQESAPDFQTLLDYIYPIAEWKPDKREYFFQNGKWYFLRDAYFRTKQGFEITVNPKGKITHICYKMKWDEPESK
ncbi:hypothetical protein [Flagellimonas crocea]|uniref:hypothetical protein n=1 Tax=Flagellimonas crocea TaxID=3067311 RepID=UPI00296F0B94|nr:hypothetical protein [Muricauda sp. DH64]